jgi:hypothetical protein
MRPRVAEDAVVAAAAHVDAVEQTGVLLTAVDIANLPNDLGLLEGEQAMPWEQITDILPVMRFSEDELAGLDDALKGVKSPYDTFREVQLDVARIIFKAAMPPRMHANAHNNNVKTNRLFADAASFVADNIDAGIKLGDKVFDVVQQVTDNIHKLAKPVATMSANLRWHGARFGAVLCSPRVAFTLFDANDKLSADFNAVAQTFVEDARKATASEAVHRAMDVVQPRYLYAATVNEIFKSKNVLASLDEMMSTVTHDQLRARNVVEDDFQQLVATVTQLRQTSEWGVTTPDIFDLRGVQTLMARCRDKPLICDLLTEMLGQLQGDLFHVTAENIPEQDAADIWSAFDTGIPGAVEYHIEQQCMKVFDKEQLQENAVWAELPTRIHAWLANGPNCRRAADAMRRLILAPRPAKRVDDEGLYKPTDVESMLGDARSVEIARLLNNITALQDSSRANFTTLRLLREVSNSTTDDEVKAKLRELIRLRRANDALIIQQKADKADMDFAKKRFDIDVKGLRGKSAADLIKMQLKVAAGGIKNGGKNGAAAGGGDDDVGGYHGNLGNHGAEDDEERRSHAQTRYLLLQRLERDVLGLTHAPESKIVRNSAQKLKAANAQSMQSLLLQSLDQHEADQSAFDAKENEAGRDGDGFGARVAAGEARLKQEDADEFNTKVEKWLNTRDRFNKFYDLLLTPNLAGAVKYALFNLRSDAPHLNEATLLDILEHDDVNAPASFAFSRLVAASYNSCELAHEGVSSNGINNAHLYTDLAKVAGLRYKAAVGEFAYWRCVVNKDAMDEQTDSPVRLTRDG